MNPYDVLTVEDDRMPAGHDWLLVEHIEGLLLVVSQSAMGSRQMMLEAWAGYRALLEHRRADPPPLHAVG